MPAALRVLQVGPLYNNHLRRWSGHAVALGCTVAAVGHVRPGRRPVDLAGVADPVEVAPEDLPDRGTSAQLAWLRAAIERRRPDLVHAHWLPRWGYLAVASGHPRVVVTAWGSDVYEAAAAERRRADWALRNAGRVLARSGHMRDEMLARGAPAERVEEVDLGVDLGRFRPAPAAERSGLRAELGLPDGPVFLSPRAGTALYNLDVVLMAFRLVRVQRPDATLVVAHGDAPLAPGVTDLLREAEGVRVLGHVPHAEMDRYLRAATAAVSIPRSDGSPSSVWEALASGLPVVLSDLPQIRERVGRSRAALLVEPHPDAVAAALLAVLADHEGMARAARAWAAANMDEDEQITRLGRVYAAMTSAPRARPPRPHAPAPVPPRGRGRATAGASPRRPS